MHVDFGDDVKGGHGGGLYRTIRRMSDSSVPR
jgi:hypothetical protein